jgi:hypothetical protein
MSDKPLHLAVSGTYSSGKTTTTEALSIATGIPRTDALTAREILVDLMPGKQFNQLNAAELLALGLRRLEERIHGEAEQRGPFISDGSVLHEWVYGEARMRVGLNPGAPWYHRALKRVVGVPSKPFMQRYMNAYGLVTQARAQRLYDAFVHLPVEFEMAKDGHRPVSEKYRRVTDELLVETLERLRIPYHVVGGSVRERVEAIVEIHELPLVMPVTEAVELAQRRIKAGRDAVAQKVIDNQREHSLLRRIGFALKY